VAAVGAVDAGVSFESIHQPPAVITLPEVAEAATRTVICADPETPALSVPRVQATWFPDRVPPAVTDTKVVPTGTVAWTCTPVAGAFPLLP
jgi:hypothetical protein